MNNNPSQHIVDLGFYAKKDNKINKLNRFMNYFCFSSIAISALLLWDSPDSTKQQSLSLACTILAIACVVLKPRASEFVESNLAHHRR